MTTTGSAEPAYIAVCAAAAGARVWTRDEHFQHLRAHGDLGLDLFDPAAPQGAR